MIEVYIVYAFKEEEKDLHQIFLTFEKRSGLTSFFKMETVYFPFKPLEQHDTVVVNGNIKYLIRILHLLIKEAKVSEAKLILKSDKKIEYTCKRFFDLIAGVSFIYNVCFEENAKENYRFPPLTIPIFFSSNYDCFKKLKLFQPNFFNDTITELNKNKYSFSQSFLRDFWIELLFCAIDHDREHKCLFEVLFSLSVDYLMQIKDDEFKQKTAVFDKLLGKYESICAAEVLKSYPKSDEFETKLSLLLLLFLNSINQNFMLVQFIGFLSQQKNFRKLANYLKDNKINERFSLGNDEIERLFDFADSEAIYDGFCSTKKKIEIELMKRTLKKKLKKSVKTSELMTGLDYNDSLIQFLFEQLETLLKLDEYEKINEEGRYLCLVDDDCLEKILKSLFKNIKNHIQAYQFKEFLERNYKEIQKILDESKWKSMLKDANTKLDNCCKNFFKSNAKLEDLVFYIKTMENDFKRKINEKSFLDSFLSFVTNLGRHKKNELSEFKNLNLFKLLEKEKYNEYLTKLFNVNLMRELLEFFSNDYLEKIQQYEVRKEVIMRLIICMCERKLRLNNFSDIYLQIINKLNILDNAGKYKEFFEKSYDIKDFKTFLNVNFQVLDKIHEKFFEKLIDYIIENIASKIEITNLIKIFDKNQNPDIKMFIENNNEIYKKRFFLIINILFDGKKVLTKEDLFETENNRIIKLACLLRENFLDRNTNFGYMNSTFLAIETIKNKLINGDLKINDYISFEGFNEYYQQNIFRLLSDSCDESMRLRKFFKENLSRIKSLKESIQNIIKCFQSFFDNLNDIENLEVKLRNIEDKMGELDIRKAEDSYQNFRNELVINQIAIFENNKFDDYCRLQNIGIFMDLFKKEKQKIKNENDKSVLTRTACLSKAYELLMNLKKILTARDLDTYGGAFDLCRSFLTSNIDTDIKLLIEFFEIEAVKNDNVINMIKTIVNRNKLLLRIEKLRQLFASFEVQYVKFEEHSVQFIENIKEINVQASTYVQRINAHIPFINKILEDENFFTFVDEIEKSKELLIFLKDKKEDDLRGLVEFVDDIGDSFIKVDTIRDLIRVLNFFLNVRLITKTNEEFLFELKNLLKKDIYATVHVYLQNVIANINGIKQLYNKITNKEEFAKVKIKEIIENGRFEIYLKNNVYTCKVIYSQIKVCTFGDILDLRDRSLLIVNEKTNKENDFDDEGNKATIFAEKCKSFTKYVDNISKMIELYNLIYLKGFFGEINQQERIIHTMNQYEIVERQVESLKKKLKKINSSIISAYDDNPNMSFFYGRQFELLFRYLTGNNTEIEFFKAQQLIATYFDQNNVAMDDDDDYDDDKEAEDFENVFKYLSSYLKTNYVKKYDLNKMNKKCYDQPDFYLFYSTQRDLELEIINTMINLTGSLPKSSNTLFCNQWTTVEQVISFIYSGIKFAHEPVYLLVNTEVLSAQVKLELYCLIEKHFKECQNTFKAIFILFYHERNLDLVNQLKLIKNIKHFKLNKSDNEELKKLFQQNIPNVNVYTSDCCGLGKSTHIMNKAYEGYKEYILFPINGEMSLNNLIERIDEFQLTDQAFLHIDLGECSDLKQLKYILFNILILNALYMQEKWCLIPSGIKIALELPYGFDDYLEKINFLQFFNCIKFERNNKIKLIVSGYINSNVQLVANYLKAYKENKIEKHNIYLGCGCEKRHWEGCLYYNSIAPQVLNEKECIQLIREYFHEYDTTSFYKINSFINILADQFRCMSHAIYFSVDQLLSNGEVRNQDIVQNRKIFIRLFIKLTEYFTNCAYDELVNAQNSVVKSFRLKNDEIQTLVNTKIISFDDIKDNFVFFNGDKQSISIICCKGNESEDYSSLKALWNSNELDYKLKELIDYTKLNRLEFFEEVKKFLFVHDFDITKLGGYVFSLDNFIKMVLIVLRTNSRIPVIMMGETGCGKTSLIKVIAQIKRIKMLILNIHAGTTDKEIIDFIENEVLVEYEKNENDMNNNLKHLETIWVFFDEINTCNSMGLITEIMCKHSYQGKCLPENISFIAACNPYKKYTKNIDFQIGLKQKSEHIVRTLVYNVKPLPYTLMNFVFDFGYPNLEDEKRYIDSMIQTSITEEDMRNYAAITILDSHKFLRELENESYVTLRDIRRTILFYTWFKESIETRQKLDNDYNYAFNHFSVRMKALILSLYVNYCCRIVKKEDRLNYKKMIANHLGMPVERLSEFIKKEQIDIVKRMDPPVGIAYNVALLENVFTLFVCINTKVPIIICGKPGCSKSLSVQLIYSSMRGNDSKDAYLKNLPRLFMNSFQGSMTSTSAGIIKIFNKARNILQDASSNEIISLVFFDEMGLAEISKNNPLKVIHYELEPDDKDKKVAFVGISNWKLDAAKMNRCIFVSRMDPDEEDLIETAVTISNSYKLPYQDRLEFHFKNLAKVYHKYKINLKNNDDKFFQDFHGTRDFYHLVKQVARDLLNKNSNAILNSEVDSTVRSFQRNFGGFEQSVESIIEIFEKIHNTRVDFKKQDSLEMIKENLSDIYARYLLLIADATTSENLVSYMLKNILKKNNYKIFLGSQFKNDTNKEEYSFKMLNKIQSCMEYGNILILKDLEMIYPALYDLFNQNFSIVGGKKYSRIALGVSNNPMALVHDDFRCIILLNEEKLRNQDPPFLNRFEKQIFSYKSLIEENVDLEVMLFFNKMIEISKDNPKETFVSHELLLNNTNKEELYSRIFKLKLENKHENTYLQLLKIGTDILCQDIIALSRISIHKNDANYDRDLKEIYEFYDSNSSSTFEKFIIDSVHKNQLTNTVVYTFSTIYSEINLELDEELNIEVNEKLISNFNSQSDFEQFVSKPVQTDVKQLIILRCSVEEIGLLNQLKFTIDTLEDEQTQSKIFIIFIHLKRNQQKTQTRQFSSKELLSNLSNWNFHFIDNLNQKLFYQKVDNLELKLTRLLDQKLEDIIQQTSIFNTENKMKSQIYNLFMSINYKFLNDDIQSDYIQPIIENILKQDVIFDSLRVEVEKHLLDNDWISRIFSSDILSSYPNLSFIEVIEKFIEQKFNEILLKLLVTLERKGGLEFILYKDSSIKNFDWFIENIWRDAIVNFKLEEVFVRMNFQENEVVKVLYQKIPFFNEYIEDLQINTKELCDKYLQYEEQIRECNDEEELNDYKKNNPLSNIISDFNSILKKSLFSKLFENYYALENLEFIFYEDYLHYFMSFFLKCKGKVKRDFLELFISFKFDIENIDSLTLSEIILWLNSNLDFIQNLYLIFDIVAKYEPNLIEIITNLKRAKLLVYPETDKIKNLNQSVNESLYLALSSLLLVCFGVVENIGRLDDELHYKFINDMVQVKQIALNLNISKYLYNEELRDIEALSNFMKLRLDRENLDNYVKKISEFFGNEKMSEKNENKLIAILNEEFKLFEEIIEISNQNDSVYDFIVKTLLAKYKKFRNQDFKFEIMKFLFSDEKITKNEKCVPVIEQALSRFDEYLGLEYTEYEDEYDDLLENFGALENMDDKIGDYMNDEVLQKNKYLIDIISYKLSIRIKNFLCDKELDNNLLLKYFEKSLEQLNQLYKNQTINMEKLFHLSFVKVFTFSCIQKEQNDGFDFTSFNKILLRHSNSVSKHLKVYILKLIRANLANFEELKNYDFLKHQITWADEFKFDQLETNQNVEFPFLNFEKQQEYNELNIQFIKMMNNEANEFLDCIYKVNDCNMVFNVIFNNLICFDTQNFVTSISYKAFAENKFPDIISKLQINENLQSYLKVLCDLQQFLTVNQEDFEMLMIAYKFALVAFSDTNSFSSDKLNIDDCSIFDNSYLVGNESDTFEFQIDVQKIKEILNLNPNIETLAFGYGAYMCSCGNPYDIEPCGCPAQETNCKKCNQIIGGQGHVLHKRAGHLRVFYNEIHRNVVVKRFPNDGTYEYKYLEDLENELDLKQDEPGLNILSFETFAKIKYLRKMKQITFRILNFYLHSITHFSSIIKLISDNNINKLYAKSNKTPLDYLRHNWDEIKGLLKNESIKSMLVFMNIVVNELSKLAKMYPVLNNNIEKINFESEFNNKIVHIILNYSEYAKQYLDYSNVLFDDSRRQPFIKLIIEEYDIINVIINNDYQHINDFMLFALPSVQDLERKLDQDVESQEKYPVLSEFLKQRFDLEKLNYLKEINPFINEILNYYSYKISRKEAYNKLIKDEKLEWKLPFDKFKSTWTKISKFATQYKCQPLVPRMISDDDPISYLLNDDAVLGYGMYIAAAYQAFINFQNNFIKKILTRTEHNSITKVYENTLKRQIIVQDACNYEILSDKLEGEYDSIEEIVEIMSMWSKVNKLEITYDFKTIEELLAIGLLPGKKLFEDREKQKFITYNFEPFRGEKSALLQSYADKIPQKSLNDNEKSEIMKFSKKFEKLLTTLQILLFYYKQREYNGETTLFETFSTMPEYITITDELKEFMESKTEFTLSKLISIYEVAEASQYSKSVETLHELYKNTLTDEQKANIAKYFQKESKINKDFICKITRRFVTRFLCGGIQDIKNDENLMNFLPWKPDLWLRSTDETSETVDKLSEMVQLEIQVGQSNDFYLFMGKDEDVRMFEDEVNDNIGNAINKPAKTIKKRKTKDN